MLSPTPYPNAPTMPASRPCRSGDRGSSDGVNEEAGQQPGDKRAGPSVVRPPKHAMGPAPDRLRPVRVGLLCGVLGDCHQASRPGTVRTGSWCTRTDTNGVTIRSGDGRRVRLLRSLALSPCWRSGMSASRPDLPSAWHLPAGLLVAGLLVVLGLWSGLGLSGLGLSPDRLASGARWGGAAAALVLAPVLVGVLLPVTRGFYDVPRAHVGFARPAAERPRHHPGGHNHRRGGGISSAPCSACSPSSSRSSGDRRKRPVVRPLAPGAGPHQYPRGGPQVALVGLGTVAATSAAGAAFSWLRLRSRQPARAHPRAPGHQHTRARSRLDPGALTWGALEPRLQPRQRAA